MCTDAGEVRIASRNYEIEWITDEAIAEDKERYDKERQEAIAAEQDAIARGEDADAIKSPRVKKPKEKSVYQQIAESLNLHDIMQPGQLIQGEIVGPGIQGNKLKLDAIELKVFHTEGIEEDSALYTDVIAARRVPKLQAVSYTHLTLPTIYSV